jgi:hypothetical protein
MKQKIIWRIFTVVRPLETGGPPRLHNNPGGLPAVPAPRGPALGPTPRDGVQKLLDAVQLHLPTNIVPKASRVNHQSRISPILDRGTSAIKQSHSTQSDPRKARLASAHGLMQRSPATSCAPGARSRRSHAKSRPTLRKSVVAAVTRLLECPTFLRKCRSTSAWAGSWSCSIPFCFHIRKKGNPVGPIVDTRRLRSRNRFLISQLVSAMSKQPWHAAPCVARSPLRLSG